MLELPLSQLKSFSYTSVSFDVHNSWRPNYFVDFLSLEMTISCETRWKPTQNQIDDLILPAYIDIAKKSVECIAKFQYPPRYVADMLRGIADALESSHPES